MWFDVPFVQYALLLLQYFRLQVASVQHQWVLVPRPLKPIKCMYSRLQRHCRQQKARCSTYSRRYFDLACFLARYRARAASTVASVCFLGSGATALLTPVVKWNE